MVRLPLVARRKPFSIWCLASAERSYTRCPRAFHGLVVLGMRLSCLAQGSIPVLGTRAHGTLAGE